MTGLLMFLGFLAVLGFTLYMNRNNLRSVIDKRGTPAQRVERARKAAEAAKKREG